MDIFTLLFYQPIFNLLVVIYRVTGGNLGLAIIAIALLSRIITIPLTTKQIKMSETSQEMNDEMKRIKKKYKNNKEKQNEEVMKLQAKYMPGQMSGCLSLIVQFVLLINIYNVIRNLVITGATSFNEVAYPFVAPFAEGAVLHTTFLGIDLAKIPSQIGFQDPMAILPYILLMILVGLSQYASTQILAGIRSRKKKDKDKPKKKKKKDESPADFSEALQKSAQMNMKLLPLFFVFMAYNFQAALSLYWTVQSGFVIIQQLAMERWEEFKKST